MAGPIPTPSHGDRKSKATLAVPTQVEKISIENWSWVGGWRPDLELGEVDAIARFRFRLDSTSLQEIKAQGWPMWEKRAMRMIQRCLILAAAFSAPTFEGAVRAEQIVVSNYGIAANGMPYAVAMEKGFFKQEGADVSGILSSSGGGTTIRNLLGGNLSYGEVDLAGTVAAIELGNDLHIISENVLTVGEFVWAVKPDSPIKSLSDFRGHKIGYTNPRSTSQALNILLVQTIGLAPADIDPIKVGGFGEQVVALDIGAAYRGPRRRRATAAVQRRRCGYRQGNCRAWRFSARRTAGTSQGG